MRKIISLLLSLFLLFLFSATSVKAQSKNFSLAKDKTISENPYFAYGETVDISGVVIGDVYAAGGEITVSGKVDGDLLVAGGNVKVDGEVTQDVRVFGGQVTISGKVGKNITVAGGNIDIAKGASVGGALVVAGGNITLSTPVAGNVEIAGGNVTVSDQVGGRLDVAAGEIRLTSGAQVAKNFTYWADHEAQIDPSAKIVGKTVFNKSPVELSPSKLDTKMITQNIWKAQVSGKLISSLSLLVIGLILLNLFPGFVGKVAATLEKSPWKSLGKGFLLVFLTPLALVILMLTIIGFPIALILFALYFVALYLAKVFVFFWAGKKIVSGKTSDNWAYALGVLVFFLVSLIPFAAGFVKLFVLLFGLGALTVSIKKFYKEARAKQAI